MVLMLIAQIQVWWGRFYPLTAVADNGAIVGHFIIRYPRDEKLFCAGFYSDDGVLCWTRLNYTDLTVRASGSPTTVL